MAKESGGFFGRLKELFYGGGSSASTLPYKTKTTETQATRSKEKADEKQGLELCKACGTIHPGALLDYYLKPDQGQPDVAEIRRFEELELQRIRLDQLKDLGQLDEAMIKSFDELELQRIRLDLLQAQIPSRLQMLQGEVSSSTTAQIPLRFPTQQEDDLSKTVPYFEDLDSTYQPEPPIPSRFQRQQGEVSSSTTAQSPSGFQTQQYDDLSTKVAYFEDLDSTYQPEPLVLPLPRSTGETTLYTTDLPSPKKNMDDDFTPPFKEDERNDCVPGKKLQTKETIRPYEMMTWESSSATTESLGARPKDMAGGKNHSDTNLRERATDEFLASKHCTWHVIDWHTPKAYASIRMTDISSYLENWLHVVWGSLHMKKGLHGYVQEKAKQQYSTLLFNAGIYHEIMTTEPGQTNVRKNRLWNQMHDAITRMHVKGNPILENADFTKWLDPQVGYWEVAKCFLDTSGYRNTTGPKDVDTSGLLSIFINSSFIRQNVSDILHFEKVRDMRNRILLKARFLMDRETAKACLDKMIALFEDPQELIHDTSVKEALGHLKKIRDRTEEIPPIMLVALNDWLKANMDDEIALKDAEGRLYKQMLNDEDRTVDADENSQERGQEQNHQGIIEEKDDTEHEDLTDEDIMVNALGTGVTSWSKGLAFGLPILFVGTPLWRKQISLPRRKCPKIGFLCMFFDPKAPGAREDVRKMKETFGAHFEIEEHQLTTSEECEMKIQNAKRKCTNRKYELFWCYFACHGSQSGVFCPKGSNTNENEIYRYRLIERLIRNNKWPEMEGKSKILFFDCCYGENINNIDTVTKSQVSSTNDSEGKEKAIDQTNNDSDGSGKHNIQEPTPKKHADILIVRAAPEGYTASGTESVTQLFCNEVYGKKIKKINIYDILHEVNKKLCEKKKSISCLEFRSRLRNSIVLCRCEQCGGISFDL